MPAVATQQLATVADLDTGPATSAMVRALKMYDATQKDIYLRRASGRILAAYGKRFPRTAGASFVLTAWGDMTIDLTVTIARHMMIADRGYDSSLPADKEIRARYEDAVKILDEIIDIENKTPRIDPDAVGGPDADDEGSLASNEGGALDQADAWTRTGCGGYCSPGRGY